MQNTNGQPTQPKGGTQDGKGDSDTTRGTEGQDQGANTSHE